MSAMASSVTSVYGTGISVVAPALIVAPSTIAPVYGARIAIIAHLSGMCAVSINTGVNGAGISIIALVWIVASPLAIAFIFSTGITIVADYWGVRAFSIDTGVIGTGIPIIAYSRGMNASGTVK